MPPSSAVVVITVSAVFRVGSEDAAQEGWGRQKRREAERATVSRGDSAWGQGRGDVGVVCGGRQPLGQEPFRAPRQHRADAGDLGVHAVSVLPSPIPAAVPGQAHQGVPRSPARPSLAGLRETKECDTDDDFISD